MSGHGATFRSKVQLRRRIVTALALPILLAALAWSAGSAQARAFLPAHGQIFAGLAGQPVSAYERAAGKHPAVYQVFSAWGEYLPGIFQDAERARARLMIHITTASGSREMIT